MIANIQGGMSMISEWSTVIGFVSMIIVKLLGLITLLIVWGNVNKHKKQGDTLRNPVFVI